MGGEGVEAAIKEMKKNHDWEVVCPIIPNVVTPQVKASALGYITFLKQKRNGDVMGRVCADGRPQQVYKTN